jgi:hypothetical protein
VGQNPCRPRVEPWDAKKVDAKKKQRELVDLHSSPWSRVTFFAPPACIKGYEMIDGSSLVANGENVVDTRQTCFDRVDPGLLLWLGNSGLVD